MNEMLEKFLLPETRCGYRVDAQKKHLWKLQIDILSEVDKICRANGIEWTAAFGTLLGAVRHKGFIPWDDDIDICMTRKNYNKFLRVASRCLPSHLFLQTSLTSPQFDLGFAQVRNSKTAGISEGWIQRGYKIHMGVGIDIFPIDKSASRWLSKIQQRIGYALASFRRCWYLSDEGRKVKSFIGKIFFLMLGGSRGCYWCTERVFSLFESLPVRGRCVLGCYCSDMKYDYWANDYFQETVLLPFEYINVPVPKNYETVLDETFGDWHVFVKGAADHVLLFFDAHTPYKKVLVEKFGYKL